MKIERVIQRANQEKDFYLSCKHTVCNMNPDAAQTFLEYGAPCPLHQKEAWKEAYNSGRLKGVDPKNWAGVLRAPEGKRERIEVPPVEKALEQERK